MNKQAIKEFLKPNWKKILIFFIIPIIFLVSENPLRLSGSYFAYLFLDIFILFPVGILGIFMRLPDLYNFWHNFPELIKIFISPFSFLAIIIWWYMLSCLIIFIYNKLKSKTLSKLDI